MNAVIGEMALQPVNAFQIGGKAVLHHKVTPKAQDISCIKQRFFLGGDEKLIGGPFEPLCLTDLIGKIIGAVIFISQPRLGC